LSSRYQDVFALLVPSCCEKSGRSCYHLVTRLMTLTDLLQVVPTTQIQAVCNKLLRACCHQPVNNLSHACRRYQTCWNNVLRACWRHQPRYKMITTYSRLVSNWEQGLRTYLVDKLWDFYACDLSTIQGVFIIDVTSTYMSGFFNFLLKCPNVKN
jgi:hypothetical protein